jgi:hypothetical protein
MGKVRTTLTVDEDVLRGVRIKAARSGKKDSEIIEAALRRDLGMDLLERIWARADMSEAEAESLALEAQRSVRRSR